MHYLAPIILAAIMVDISFCLGPLGGRDIARLYKHCVDSLISGSSGANVSKWGFDCVSEVRELYEASAKKDENEKEVEEIVKEIIARNKFTPSWYDNLETKGYKELFKRLSPKYDSPPKGKSGDHEENVQSEPKPIGPFNVLVRVPKDSAKQTQVEFVENKDGHKTTPQTVGVMKHTHETPVLYYFCSNDVCYEISVEKAYVEHKSMDAELKKRFENGVMAGGADKVQKAKFFVPTGKGKDLGDYTVLNTQRYGFEEKADYQKMVRE